MNAVVEFVERDAREDAFEESLSSNGKFALRALKRAGFEVQNFLDGFASYHLRVGGGILCCYLLGDHEEARQGHVASLFFKSESTCNYGQSVFCSDGVYTSLNIDAMISIAKTLGLQACKNGWK